MESQTSSIKREYCQLDLGENWNFFKFRAYSLRFHLHFLLVVGSICAKKKIVTVLQTQSNKHPRGRADDSFENVIPFPLPDFLSTSRCSWPITVQLRFLLQFEGMRIATLVSVYELTIFKSNWQYSFKLMNMFGLKKKKMAAKLNQSKFNLRNRQRKKKIVKKPSLIYYVIIIIFFFANNWTIID